MIPHILGHAVSDVTTLVRHYGPRMQRTCNDWVQKSLSSSVICGIGSGTIEVNIINNQIQVKDSTAPPVVKKSSYRFAPTMLTYKLRSAKRRSRGRGGSNRRDGDDNGDNNDDGDGDDDGPGWDEGGFGGSNGWNGNGGNNDKYWGSYNSWNHENGNDNEWWEGASDAVLTFLYQVACWISLSQCLQFVIKKFLDAHEETKGVSMVVDDYLSCSIRTSSASS